jgi:hypothetical protein
MQTCKLAFNLLKSKAMFLDPNYAKQQVIGYANLGPQLKDKSDVTEQ